MNFSVLSNPGEHVLLWGLNVLLQVTAVMLVALTAARFMRTHAAARYWGLCAAFLLVLLTPLVTAICQSCGGGLWSVSMLQESVVPATDATENRRQVAPPPSLPTHERELSAPNTVTPSTRLTFNASAFEQPEGRGERHADFRVSTSVPSALSESDRSNVADEQVVASITPQEVVRAATTQIRTLWPAVMAPLLVIWLMGAIVLLVRLVINLRRLSAILRSVNSNATAALCPFAEDVVRRLRVEPLPLIVLSDRVASPISAGLLRPCVILPERLVDELSAEQMRDILVHELAHVERRDQWIVLLQHFFAALFWIHPLARTLNRELAKAREEICDNYVLATTTAPSYSRTLLAVAELVTQRPLPGAVGLFTSQWKLEERVANLLDEHRSRVTDLTSRAKLVIAAVALAIATVAALLGTVTLAAQPDSDPFAPTKRAASANGENDVDSRINNEATLRGPTLRNTGNGREMLLRGHVFDEQGNPARDFQFVAKAYKDALGRDVLPAKVEGNQFEVWVPISGSYWMYVELAVSTIDGDSRVFRGIQNRELRQAAIEGIDLRLVPANRTVEISVTHNGAPVVDAYVHAELSGNMLLQSKTDAEGIARLRLSEDEKLQQLTAWTDDFRIGGFSFDRKPRRDPRDAAFTIELDNCRGQTIRLLDADNAPVAHVPFELVLGTGEPNYNFVAIPTTFPHCRMTTDEKGESIFRWFPDWKTHGAYVEISDRRWATAVEPSDWTIGDDGALLMSVKQRASRKPLVGKVTSDRHHVGGLLVEIKSFQGEQEGRSDFVYAFTDELGNFTADCLPGATYTVCVNDGRLQSNMIDVVPYELDSGKSNFAELKLAEGRPVDIRVTSGPDHEPMRGQSVHVRQIHSYKWQEDGRTQNGQGARDFPVVTDDQGMARAWALPGSELRITVYAGEWRSDERIVTVKEQGITLVEFHRTVDQLREVTGRLLAPRNVDAELAGATIVFGSIDGETDERQQITADAEGRFDFQTKAIQLGIFAYTTDGKAAVVAKPQRLDRPIRLQLKPTMDLHGQLLGPDDKPLAFHGIRVQPRVSGQRDFNKSFATSFPVMTFEARTDKNGNYTLSGLPIELDMRLQADPINGSQQDEYLQEFYLVPGEQRSRIVSRLAQASETKTRSVVERYDSALRMAKLDNYYVLVLCYDATSSDFVNSNMLDPYAIPEVASFLNLHIDENSLTQDADRQFVEAKDWPPVAAGKVFACALDGSGKELARIELDIRTKEAASEAAKFIAQNAPLQADARAKWEGAFAEARRSGRRVWARIGQRYCGPCFGLSLWLDDNRELLERDYVLLKIDDVRDKHGAEVASLIVRQRKHVGVPFHAIFDADEQLLIDSISPIGNIGHPSGFEGRRHVTKMLSETRRNLSEADIQQIVDTLVD